MAISQVMETIKLLAGFGNLLADKMLYVQGEKIEFNFVELSKKPNCRVCGDNDS
jgi:hypothetical protein